jgi:hypothetical protein
MLKKEPGNHQTNKLRAILLMEAYFNFPNKLFFGKRMMEVAKNKGEIPAECYGSKGTTKPSTLLSTGA